MKISAAWKALRSDEFILVAKKHCRIYEYTMAGVGLKGTAIDDLKKDIVDMGMKCAEALES